MICNKIDEDEEINDKDFQCLKVSTEVLSKVVEYCTHYQTVEEMNVIAFPLTGETVEDNVTQDWYCDFCKVRVVYLISPVQLLTVTSFRSFFCRNS